MSDIYLKNKAMKTHKWRGYWKYSFPIKR